MNLLSLTKLGDQRLIKIYIEDSDKCKKAIEREVSTLKENKTWKEVKCPPDISTIACKCVFKSKKNGQGEPFYIKPGL